MNSNVRVLVLACSISVLWINQLFAAAIFVDSFESGTAGNNIGAPWGANNITPATYGTAGNPFSDGSTYAALNDPAAGTSPAQAIRLLSNAGNANSLTPSLAGLVSTYSFNFWEP